MNFNVIDQAVKLVRDKFKIDFIVNNYTIQTDPEDVTIGTWIKYRREPELKMTLTVIEDHTSWTEHTDLDYVIFGSDIQDGSLVDEVIGGNIKGYEPEIRMALRLAFIIYNGIQYGVKREQRKDYIDKGWHPRVVSVKMRY
jgi:hypothetical protein